MIHKKMFNFKQITLPFQVNVRCFLCLRLHCDVGKCPANNKTQTKELNENHAFSCIYSFYAADPTRGREFNVKRNSQRGDTKGLLRGSVKA